MVSIQELSYEEAPRIIVTPPRPKSKQLLAKQSQLETRAVIYSKAFPFAIDSATLIAEVSDVTNKPLSVTEMPQAITDCLGHWLAAV